MLTFPATCMGFITAGVFFLTNCGCFCGNVMKVINAQNVIVYFFKWNSAQRFVYAQMAHFEEHLKFTELEDLTTASCVGF